MFVEKYRSNPLLISIVLSTAIVSYPLATAQAQLDESQNRDPAVTMPHLSKNAITTDSIADECFGASPTIIGTEGDDLIDGTAGNDVIVGLGEMTR